MPTPLRRGPFAAALVAAGCALALAGGAAALAAAAAAQSRPLVAIFLRGSDGYAIQLATFGPLVALEAARGGVGAAYAVRGRVSAKRLEARFGRLGRIAASFRPLRLGGGEDGACVAGGTQLSIGYFVGTIRFRGEQGYTAVSTRRAPGIVVKPDARACRAGARRSAVQPPPFDTFLAAISRDRGGVTAVEVGRRRGEQRLTIEASRQERRGRMRIFRAAATTIGGENAFLSSGPGVHPAFARVFAPKPFSGSALFLEGPSYSARWTGSLRAWLPGLGHVPVAGPRFASSLCRRDAESRGCSLLPTVRRPLWLPQGSGSQSQALREVRLSWSR